MHRRLVMLAALGMVALSIWVLKLLGGFNLMATLDVDGRVLTIANTFSTVDHPFHATRSDVLLEALRDGDILRWVGNHHGGYPVEFYPVGAAWIDVALWAILWGQFPIIAVHKLGVIVVFLLPGIAYWLLARGDRAHPFVPLLALAIHLAVPGFWWNGGYLELVEWGLVANVGGAALALIAFAGLGRYVVEGGRWYAILAALAASGAIFTNMRSGIAVAVSALSILLAVTIRRDPDRAVGLALAVARIALVAVVALLLAAPLLLAMAQYSDSYHFVHFLDYSTFTDIRDPLISYVDYWDSVVASVSWWFLVPAMAAIPIAFLVRELTMLRMIAICTLAYSGLTVALSRGGMDDSLIRQLETPRLMPFQRFLMIYLAAAAIGWVIQNVLGRVVRVRWQEPIVAIVLVGIVAVTVTSYPGTFGPLPETDLTAPRDAHTTGLPELAQFTSAIEAANTLRQDGTSILVIGDQESWWHEQLWAPSVEDGPYYYDDWMWYWHPDRPGPYNYDQGHFFPSPAQILTSEWLAANGVSMVVVTNMGTVNPDPRDAAADSPLLEYQQTFGYWDVFRVRDIVPLVTNDGILPVSSAIGRSSISATFESASGDVQVRTNWFPRWAAYADGEEVPVTRTDQGTMTVLVPDGTREVVLEYEVTRIDWLGRILALIGVAAVVFVATGRPDRYLRELYPATGSEAS
ncbi:MAG TPA: hypothetical protein VD767_01570 [Thermomicrobiales bacterium]|nr:hypothetical protein [Thermomicrobiales bacterium]